MIITYFPSSVVIKGKKFNFKNLCFRLSVVAKWLYIMSFLDFMIQHWFYATITTKKWKACHFVFSHFPGYIVGLSICLVIWHFLMDTIIEFIFSLLLFHNIVNKGKNMKHKKKYFTFQICMHCISCIIFVIITFCFSKSIKEWLQV